MADEQLPVQSFPPLNLKSRHVTYNLRPEDLEVIQSLYQHLCTRLGSKLGYVEFFRMVNATLLARVLETAGENIIVKVVEISPISHIEENKLLRKELALLKKQFEILKTKEEDIIDQSPDTVHRLTTEVEKLEQKLKDAISSRDQYKSKIDSLQNHIEKESRNPKSNEVILNISALEFFEQSLSKRIEAKLSESREDFIRQLYSYTRATQPAKYF